MDILQAIILSIVEGITEFLPVSSTGHQVLVASILQIPQTEFVKSFEIFIQLGAILAIVVIYFRKLLAGGVEVWKKILAAFIPTAVVGLVLYKVIKGFLLGNDLITVLALLIGGVILIVIELIHKEKESHVSSINNLTIKQCVLIGLAQSISVIPGVSRSAASIVGAMLLGVKRSTAVEFSFMLAIPTLIAATGLDLVKSNFSFTRSEWLLMLIGLVGSFITALIVVKWFLSFVQKNNFIPFGIYRILVAILFWLVIIRT